MRLVTLGALLVALVLAATACGNDAEETPEDDDADVTAPAVGDRGAELDDDVAAVVNGREIPRSRVEEQVEMFSANPQIAEALEGDDAELTMAVLQAQVLTTLIINAVALEAAEDLGVPVTDDDVEAARDELEADAGGAEGLAEAIEQEGIPERELTRQLRALAAMRNIQAALAEDADDEDADDPDEDADDPDADDAAAADPDELRAQQYVSQRLLAADVVVNDDYGTWDPQRGQVVPPGGLPQPVPAPPQDDEDAPPES